MKVKILGVLTAIGIFLALIWYFFLIGDEDGGNKSITKKKIKQKKANIDEIKKKIDFLDEQVVTGKKHRSEVFVKIDELTMAKKNIVAEIHEMTDKELAAELGDLLGDL